MLGPELGLSLHLSVAAGIIGIVVGAAFSAFNSTLGAKLGLRQIASSRFSFGIYGAKLCSCLNVVTLGGFLVVGLIAVGSLLSAAADYQFGVITGIVLVSVITYFIALFGYQVIHTFEKYSWIATAILLCVLCGQAAPHSVPSAPSVGTPLSIAGSFLSMLAVNMSNGVGWCAIASDYLVNYPTDISRVKVWCLVYGGLVVAMSFVSVNDSLAFISMFDGLIC